MKKMLKWIFVGCLFSYVNLFCLTGVYAEDEGWQGKDFFKIKNINGRPIFISPEGEPFYAISMVYAYGPESGPNKGDLTAEKVIKELERMGEHGFNTIDLYGDFFLKEMLDWCESNEMSLYFRTSYTHLDDFPGHLKDFPDFMDANFRERAKQQYTDFLILIKDYRCVLAVDMDQRWLFEIHWNGEKRFDVPKLGLSSVKYLPIWLEDKYKDIGVLNKLWKKNYSGFEDILNDDEIIKGGVVQPLSRYPWRVDLVEYSNWTINDFLLELTAYMKLIDPNHMITYTTELPEPVPFPLSTKENSGIDFISPVHYNNDSDFDRDWVANGEMFYMTKFHYDLQKLPVYINETGFRTSPLAANPANMGYASAKFNDEQHLADLYLIQTALMDTYPWLLGWAWFKWYDKLYEGDFGYVRDDNSLKPVSKLGEIINTKIPINMNAEDTPEVWIYYPEYALASEEPAHPQLRTLVLLLENDFLAEFDSMIEEVMPFSSNPSDEMLDKRLFKQLPDTFKKEWRPFAFTSVIPDDDKPVILVGSTLKQLSMEDRKILRNKKTITFGPVGLTDERYNPTEAFYIELIGGDIKAEKVTFSILNLKKYFNNKGIFLGSSGKKADFDGDGNAIDKNNLPDFNTEFKTGKNNIKFVLSEKDGNDNIVCAGQKISVKADSYTSAYFLMASIKGDAVAKVELQYEGGSKERVNFAPAVSDWSTPPFFSETGLVSTINSRGEEGKEKTYISVVKVPLSSAENLKSVILPEAARVHIFAITLSKGESSSGVLCGVKMGSKKATGRTDWLTVIDKGDYKVLAQFGNGYPAIVQSKDGKHIAFLFDALTWTNMKDAISRDTENLSAMLDKVLLEFLSKENKK